jgi:uncharacterized lipoprotein YddW (UPF0748 family)
MTVYDFFRRIHATTVILLSFVACVNAQHSPKRELRAAWIATVMNIDWPSQKDLSSSQQKDEFCNLLDTLKSVGMNAVIVQVRPAADAFYPSSYEPWSEYLTGKQGRPPEPYYNPLAFMIEQAHARGLEFHAWFNPYRASMNESFTPATNHPILQRPDWFLRYGGKIYYDPGHPEARNFVLDAILEVVRHNDVDAIHFDDYFYPYRIAGLEFPDDSTYACYGKGDFTDKDSWRRNNVNHFVENLYTRLQREKPHVKMGISPFGVWRNNDKDVRGSATQAGQTNYDDLYADVLKWLSEGWIDYVTPQIYWHIGFDKAEYKTLVEWWSRNSHGRHVYIGQGIYRIGQNGWTHQNEIVNQVSFNRSVNEVQGSMYFSAKVFAKNKLGINRKIDSLYSIKALVPTMPWKKSNLISPPELLDISGSVRKGVTLEWKDDSVNNASYYVVYRFKSPVAGPLDDAASIVDIVPRKAGGRQRWLDTTVKRRTVYTYVVTSVERLHQESTRSNGITLKTRRGRLPVRIK